MNYCAPLDMQELFGEHEMLLLTDKNGTGVMVVSVADKAIKYASSKMLPYLLKAKKEGYLLKTNWLPADLPDLLPMLCCDIARYYLYDDNRPQTIIDRYDDAFKCLLRVSMGKIKLEEEEAGNDTAQMISEGRVFGRHENSFI